MKKHKKLFRKIKSKNKSNPSQKNSKAIKGLKVQAYDHMASWAQTHGAEALDLSLRAKGHKRGIFSEQNIEKGQVVLKIPMECIFSSIGENALPLELELIKQKQLNNSQFLKYFKTLPENFKGHPITFDAGLFFKNTFFGYLQQIIRRSLQSDFEQINRENINFELTYEDYLWARLVVLTRAHTIQDEPILIPLIDLLNHSQKPNCIFAFSVDKGNGILIAQTNIPKGEEIKYNYDPNRSPLMLCLKYAIPFSSEIKSPSMFVPEVTESVLAGEIDTMTFHEIGFVFNTETQELLDEMRRLKFGKTPLVIENELHILNALKIWFNQLLKARQTSFPVDRSDFKGSELSLVDGIYKSEIKVLSFYIEFFEEAAKALQNNQLIKDHLNDQLKEMLSFYLSTLSFQ